ncbi:MAG: hypothetical protein KGH54_04685 [Candidatus Micrarchaeota archaeon]|nr:hypothetical protein [Candidatus Micrarchaeota archaeon]
MARKVTKDDLIMNTKEGCHLGVLMETKENGETKRDLIFGKLQRNYDDKNDAINFKTYLVLDLKEFEIKEIKRDGGQFSGLKPENFVIGKQLLHTLGGESKTIELLDALGFKFSISKYKEYLNTAKRMKKEADEREKEEERETKRKLKQARVERLRGAGIYHPNLEKIRSGIIKIGTGLALAGGLYLTGLSPWALNNIGIFRDKISEKTHLSLKEGSQFVGLTSLGNWVASVGYLGVSRLINYHTGITSHLSDQVWIAVHTPALFAFEALCLAPVVSLGVVGSYRGINALHAIYQERKEREEAQRRLESVRQAFCPADSESYYQV